ncbi:mannose-1-phosphate guanylyltransferase/mannose-6-phosphate isomerase [Rhodobium orientis]|nr:mannose-1-phosphate guanylyltransferase/mannose-6-phosphate isomerase [Rhodobium orientis]
MCGGSGTRLWPMSRRSYPKQFLSLLGERSLLQNTVKRLNGHVDVETIIIANEEHRFLVAEQLKTTSAAGAEIILEPLMRNTAPVALVAAVRAAERFGEDCLVLLSPADHFIADPSAYCDALSNAIPAAEAGYLVTLGIEPDRPETGYGYIEIGEPLADIPGVRRAKSFHEKPDRQTAEKLLSAGSFAWNAGVFLFSPKHLVSVARHFQPKMLAYCEAACAGAEADLCFFRLDSKPYARIDNMSFDVAFAEKLADRVAVVPVSMGWSDIGSWNSIYEVRSSGENGENISDGPVELYDSQGVLAVSDGPLVVGQGVKDLVIVANHDAIFVAPKDQSEKVKAVVADLEKRNRREAVTHQRCYRPWGWYQVINLGERFQVKEIVVEPGAQLSLQSHHHRSEHWIVVRGTARVTVDEEVRSVSENQSVYIPLGSLHRLENPGRIPMHLIEVQTGSYLEEDDIVRHNDAYGRR